MLLIKTKNQNYFFRSKNEEIILDLIKEKYFITDELFQIEDISINSIDQKNGIFEIRLYYNFAKLFTKEAYKNFYNIVEDKLIFKNESDIWSLEVCIYSKMILKNQDNTAWISD